MLLPEPTPDTLLLLKRPFRFIGSVGVVLLTTKRGAELIVTPGFHCELATEAKACVVKDHTEDVMAAAQNKLKHTLKNFLAQRSFRRADMRSSL